MSHELYRFHLNGKIRHKTVNCISVKRAIYSWTVVRKDKHTHTLTLRNMEDWRVPPGGLLPSLAVAIISAKLLSASIFQPHSQTHTSAGLSQGSAGSLCGRYVVTRTRMRCCCCCCCCCALSLPPHRPCHLTSRPAVPISMSLRC